MCGLVITVLTIACVCLVAKIYWIEGQSRLQEQTLNGIIDDLDKRLDLSKSAEARVESDKTKQTQDS